MCCRRLDSPPNPRHQAGRAGELDIVVMNSRTIRNVAHFERILRSVCDTFCRRTPVSRWLDGREFIWTKAGPRPVATGNAPGLDRPRTGLRWNRGSCTIQASRRNRSVQLELRNQAAFGKFPICGTLGAHLHSKRATFGARGRGRRLR